MRIALSNPRRGWGGTASVLKLLGEGLDRRGHDVHYLVRPDSAFASELGRSGFPVARVLRGYEFPLVAAARSALYLRERNVDVILSGPEKDLRLGALGGKLARIPVVALGVMRPSSDLLNSALWSWIPDRIVANSNHTREGFLALDGVDPDCVTVIPNGIELEAFTSPEPASVPSEPKAIRIVFVGRIDPDKGVQHLIEAWPYVRDRVDGAQLLMVGRGGLESDLRYKTRADPTVRWMGFRRDIPEVLAACDLAVVPAPEEAFGVAALEAMASGLPVVGTRAGGLPEVVRHGTDGRLVLPGDPRQLASVLIELAVDREERRRLGRNARERAQDFTADNMVAGYEKTLLETVHNEG